MQTADQSDQWLHFLSFPTELNWSCWLLLRAFSLSLHLQGGQVGCVGVSASVSTYKYAWMCPEKWPLQTQHLFPWLPNDFPTSSLTVLLKRLREKVLKKLVPFCSHNIYRNRKQLWFGSQICSRSKTLWGGKDPRGSPDDAGDPLQSWQLHKNLWAMFVVEPCSSSDPPHQTATLWEAFVLMSPECGNRWPINSSVFLWRDEGACSQLNSSKYSCS